MKSPKSSTKSPKSPKPSKKIDDKRKLTGYQRFVYQQMKKMNADVKYNVLTPQDKLKLIAALWKATH